MQLRIHDSVRTVLIALAEIVVFATVLASAVSLLVLEQIIVRGLP